MYRYYHKQLNLWKVQDYWDTVNEIEQVWTGIEEVDRASLAKWDRAYAPLVQVGCLTSYTTTGS